LPRCCDERCLPRVEKARHKRKFCMRGKLR
jgi:hypothetical protein